MKEDQKLYFLPLGGSGEIGMNLNLYNYEGKWLMVDLGITFHDRLGVDVILPNPQFILERKKDLVGLLLTHGHEDHIGAVPYLWEQLKCPIYATPFTAELVKAKLRDHHIDYEGFIHIIPLDGQEKIGPFSVEMVTLTHSIPEPNGVLIRTPAGNIFHTGDWKIDLDPLIGEPIDHAALQKIGDEGVLAMVCDSTNVFTHGRSGSESDVRENLTELIGSYSQGAVFVTCFASNLARLETIAMAAQAHGRQVVLLGRGFHRVNEISRNLGYLKHLASFIEARKAKDMPRHKVLYLCSGSQGEYRAALNRIASGSFPDVKMLPKDIVIFSSRVIPGNEKGINGLKNKIIKLGVQVITDRVEDIHVSGHPSQEDLIQMYEWIRPKILIPVHGEAIHMVEQGRLAKKNGIKNVVIPENGTLIEISEDARIIEEVPAGRLARDGNMIFSFNHASLKERQRLSTDGVGVIVVVLDEEHALKDNPSLVFQGVNVDPELQRECMRRAVESIENLSKIERHKDALIQDKVRGSVQRVIQNTIEKKPTIIVQIVRL